MVMSSMEQRYRDISPVTLQVVGGAVSSSLYCGEVEGVGRGLVESFLVELYRCKLCQFTCSLKASISSHLLLRHRPHTLTYLGEDCGGGGAEDREGAGLEEGASPYQLVLNVESKNEDEDFLLYNMLENMSPPTCNISSEGGLQVSHTCEVSTLFEEEEGGGEESCPVDAPSTQEEMAQSAHLMTLGLCRISTAKPAPLPAAPPPPSSPKSIAAPPQKRKRRLLCLLCPLTLPSRRQLDVHVRSHCAAGGFSCVSCSWTCDSWKDLEAHWRGHRRRRRGGRRCEGQEEKQKNKKKKKKKAGWFSCPICLRMFRSSASRNTHKKTHDSCKQRFHDDNSDRQRCCLIGPGGGKEAGLTDRLVSSQTSRSQSDSLQSVTENREKTRIKKRKEGQKTDLYCSLCDRTFSSKLTLRRHVGVHEGIKPFSCPHCSYCSRLKASLLQHLRTHTGERPYRCAECAYASIDRSSLLRHSRTHSQERPYRCELCDYSSIQKKSLDLHARRHHTGLLRVRAADQISDDQVKTLELNKLLQTIIKLPHKFSQSEAVRDFFKPSAVDQIFRKDQDQDRTSKQQTSHMFTCEHQEVDQSIPYEDQEVDQSIPYEDQDEGWSIRHEDQDEDQSIMHEDQDEDQSIMHEEQNLDMFLSPVISTLPDILRSNGFCLANTETILFDLTPPTQPVNQSEDSKGRRASVGPSVCLQLCHPSVSLMMGRLKGRSFRHAPPPSLPPSTCCTPGPRRCTSWSD